jgi:hypothetical protein
MLQTDDGMVWIGQGDGAISIWDNVTLSHTSLPFFSLIYMHMIDVDING